ncbi:MAG: LysR family transcriptional regulator [Bradyrhizobium sp.]|nr:LysR family transcriptional regulator [Bradyrhizobium sp.]
MSRRGSHAVADTRSFTRAAAVVNLTQSAVTGV